MHCKEEQNNSLFQFLQNTSKIGLCKTKLLVAFHPKAGVCKKPRWRGTQGFTARLSVVIVCKTTGNVITELGAERFLKYRGLVQWNKTLPRIN